MNQGHFFSKHNPVCHNTIVNVKENVSTKDIYFLDIKVQHGF